MKCKKVTLMVMIMAIMVTVTGFTAADYVPGEIIVRLEHGILDPGTKEEVSLALLPINNSQLRDAMQRYDAYSVERLFKGVLATPPFQVTTRYGEVVQLSDLSQVYIFRLNQRLDMEQVAKEVGKLPGVIYAEPNYIYNLLSAIPNDADFWYKDVGPYWDYQWGLNNNYAGEAGWDINAPQAWSIETGSRDILLAIIDTGLENDHYDETDDEFADRINARARVAHSWSWLSTPPENPTYEEMDDESGHGTHVAGIAAAAINTAYGQGGTHGIAGVAGGWGDGEYPEDGVELAIANCGPYLVNVTDAIEWVVGLPADVLNGSFGGGGPSYIMCDAIAEALKVHMSCVFGAGNIIEAGQDVYYPAAFSPLVHNSAVGSMVPSGTRAYTRSSYGPGAQLSFVAPGYSIYSTWIEGGDGYYRFDAGTSMASPHAAGVACLLKSAALDVGYQLRDVDCKRIMEHSARDIKPGSPPENEDPVEEGYDIYTGWGCVDAWESLRHLYWPYTLTHRSTSTLNDQVLSTGDVYFFDTEDLPPGAPAGTYHCRKSRVYGTISYSGYLEKPWVWARVTDGSGGYCSGSGGDAVWNWDTVYNITTNSATVETYAYYILTGDYAGEWVPCAPNDMEIAYTVIGRTASDSWKNRGSVVNPLSDLVVAYGPDCPNDVHVAYATAPGNIYYGLDKFDATWNPEFVDDSCYQSGGKLSIDVDAGNNPHIGYAAGDPLTARHAWKDGSWHTEIIDQNFTGVFYVSIACDVKTGRVHAAYCTSGGFLKYRVKFENGTWSPVIDVDWPASQCAIAIDADGYAHIAYLSTSGPDYLIKHAYITSISPPYWVTEVIELENGHQLSQDYPLGWPDIAFDGLGRTNICYYSDSCYGGSLYECQILRCATREVSGWEIETVDNTLAGYNQYTSICRDFDGQMIISYNWHTLDGMAYMAKRSSSGWSKTLIQQDDVVSAIGVDNLGRPVAVTQGYPTRNLMTYRHAQLPQQELEGSMLMSSGIQPPELKKPESPGITAILPNPAVGSATIHYQLPFAADTRIAVYDVTGREVTTLLSGEQPAGSHELIWDGIDDAGRSVSTGVYFVRMETPNHQVNKKITLIR